MAISSKLRFLEIGRDPWIGRSFSADFLPLGRSLAPGGHHWKSDLNGLVLILWRLARRRYDIVALGPLQVRRTIGLGLVGRFAKKCISAIAQSATLASLVRKVLCGNTTRIVILDIDDTPAISEAALAIFRPIVYFKRNLSRHDFESGNDLFQPLPIAIEPFPERPIPKDADIFVCGGYTTETRRVALQTARTLLRKGWKVDIAEHPIPYQEYRRRVFSARTVFAFQGCGFHTWRMYEAAAARAVPILDAPDTDIIHDFVDAENCLVVVPAVEPMVSKVDELLRDPARVDTVASAAYQLATTKHTPTSCAGLLVAEIERALERSSSELSKYSRERVHGQEASPNRAIARANVLGVGVSALNLKQACELIVEAARQGEKGFVAVTGVHGVSEAQNDPEFRRILNSAFLNTPDGMPMTWVGRWQGFRHMDRVYGPDLMLKICEATQNGNIRHFLYGGAPGVAESLRDALVKQFPHLCVCGTYTPPFRPLTSAEEEMLKWQMESCRPDILWVGLSTPKQEKFMAAYHNRVPVTIMIGVGAAFDMLSGRKRQAPRWMQRSGLEWFFRLVQEPRRLWKRYLINNPLFILRIMAQFSRIREYSLELQ